MENDIRYTVTNEIIKNSLKSIMENKPINKIKIIDICKEANISRTTFYNHYVDIYDLIEDFEKDILNDLDIKNFQNIDNSEKNLIKLLENVLDYVLANETMYIRFFEANNMTFYNIVLDFCMEKIFRDFSTTKGFASESEAIFYFRYHSFGFLSTLEDWLMTSPKIRISKRELATYMARNMKKY